MSTPLTALLGLTPSSPTLGPSYLIFHFIYAYILLSSRPWKLAHKIDHNVSPRDDLTKYGPSAVAKGKLTQRQLDRIRRVENCHANSVENFPLLVAAVVLAHVGGLENSVVNGLGLWYTVVRVGYAGAYIFNERSRGVALLRGVFWWTGNIVCLRVIGMAGKVMNAKI
ncbi:hypothetical protein M409DRAFT_50337 [Zasmidium cellare ATCC 36951]|uniref:Uncharacterized protein n=1 Tax=Zasmidium cellare ATCC 36951 TaxID=1080233 RepID=A0A6A6D0I8_ZASCE|nr:uncharacterized protein M409DRAFT_50337 [Zasmidium cellare ATCC 36951]KAF2171672.1 hypothetical protein M409DRAFT_50337 [Zasmidium cellare ATCC 36951]